MFDMFGGFSGSKLKAQLKMAITRLQIASNKKSALLKQNKREISMLLKESPPKEEKARIRAEAMIREDNIIEAHEILQLECELISERIKLIEFNKDCPGDLVSVISTLIYASPRVDVPELTQVRKLFRAKYGKKFEERAFANEGGILNERVVTKLSIDPPAALLVQTYLERICEEYDVQWKPQIPLTAEQSHLPTVAPVGYSVPMAQGSGLGPVTASTGLENTDAEVSYQQPSSKDGWVDPPVVQAYIPPPSNGGGGGGKGGKSDFAEPDIFIPPAPSAYAPVAPSAPADSSVNIKPPATAPSEHSNNDNDDDDDENNNYSQSGGSSSGGVGGGSGGDSTSYRDLASRFAKLQKDS